MNRMYICIVHYNSPTDYSFSKIDERAVEKWVQISKAGDGLSFAYSIEFIHIY